MVKIIADTTSCLDSEFSRQHDIPIIPQVINFGTESYLEGVNLDIPGFMARLQSAKELPKTAAPPPELFAEQFARLAPLGETILCIHPSSEVSGTVRSATVAAMDFPGLDIRILDTRVITSPLGTMVKLAAGWAEAGESADTIIDRLMDLSRRCRVYFMVDTLEYLQRGGRIGNAAALLGSVLQIKPILRIHNGKVDQYERERTHKRAVNRLIELVCEQAPQDGNAYVTVLEAGNKPEAHEIAAQLGQIVGQPDVPVFHMPPAIVTHGGPGILGVGFFTR
ncbi:MAG: DegV family protein [Chloroflexota bacterium]